MTIKVLDIITEDFIQYKKPSMFISFPYCTWKCGKENCQNRHLESAEKIEIEVEKLIAKYVNNPITQAIVIGGLEPFDSPEPLVNFIYHFRKWSDDDIVIYTGYTEEEVINGQVAYSYSTSYNKDMFTWLTKQKNIIVKFGRYVSNQQPHLDEVLGVKLASDNQYAKRLTPVELLDFS
jgi:organic radical activating enzyme